MDARPAGVVMDIVRAGIILSPIVIFLIAAIHSNIKDRTPRSKY